jgi:hypothetical protein
MITAPLTCFASVSGKPLTLEILANGNLIYKQLIESSEPVEIAVDVPDNDNELTTIEFVMSGKTDHHTITDNNGNIIEDSILKIEEISIDYVDLTPIIEFKSLPYAHDFNGNGEKVVEQFTSEAGCNGIIKLEFTGPFILWLDDQLTQ